MHVQYHLILSVPIHVVNTMDDTLCMNDWVEKQHHCVNLHFSSQRDKNYVRLRVFMSKRNYEFLAAVSVSHTFIKKGVI